MLKKFFLMLAALLIFAQIPTAHADVAIPVRPPINQFPIRLTIQSIDEENSQITLQISRRKADVKQYFYSVYRKSGLYIVGNSGEFHNRTELITFEYKDLAKDTPEDLKLEIETVSEYSSTIYGDKKRQRPSYFQMNYVINFSRHGNELTAEVLPYER